jgi:hypothetical protein
MEFKELTKKDAQISLALELDKLVRTCSEGERQVRRGSEMESRYRKTCLELRRNIEKQVRAC